MMQRGIKHVGFVSRSPRQTRLFGEMLGAELVAGDLILLDGPFGAGKTTLVQGLAVGAGTEERVTSPSFTLINEYRGRLPIWHVDLFRLNRLDIEIEQALEDCEQGAGVTVVEWPSLMPADLREGAMRVEMQVLGDTDRSLIFHLEDSRWEATRLERMMETAMREGNGRVV